MKKSVVEKVKMAGELPGARFGHTFTMVSDTKAVLFGGAIAAAGKFIINNETFLYDFSLSKWSKLQFGQEFVPMERAAHAAVKVYEYQMLVYGGAPPNSQSSLKDELYILDLRKEAIWRILEVTSKTATPGDRYGHVLLYSKPYVLIFGGISGGRAQNDVWLLNIVKGPFHWQKYDFGTKPTPCPRVYHSAAICEQGSAQGMIVVFGGRKDAKRDHNGSLKEANTAALNDVWGLRRHRDGSWDWATPPKSATYSPLPRYQHLVCFVGSMLVIVGGRTQNNQQTASHIQIYDTQRSEWIKALTLNRYRHAVALYQSSLFVYGGFQPQYPAQPVASMSAIDFSQYQNNQLKVLPQRRQLREVNESERNIIGYPVTGRKQAMQESERSRSAVEESEQMVKSGRGRLTMNKSRLERDLTPSRVINANKNIRLANQVVVAKGGELSNMHIQRVPVNSLLEESKKLTSTFENGFEDRGPSQLADYVIGILMPMHSTHRASPTSLFPFKKDKVIKLCQEACKVVAQQSSLLGVRAPARVFGSLYGRYHDLISFFHHFGYPDEREMESSTYVFLGNFVDKGFNSLQTLCLLMALKIKHTDHIILLRGRHEDAGVNRACGLGEECTIRLGENISQPNSIYNLFNSFFELLPLAAAIQDTYLCVSGGVTPCETLLQIKEITRPVKVKNNSTLMNMLWGAPRSEKSPYEVKKQSQEEVQSFLQNNGLEMLINSVDGLQNGVEESNSVLSVFSVANYGQSSNRAGMLKINKEHEIVPCLLNGNETKKMIWVTEHATKTNLNFTNAQMEIRSKMFIHN